MKSKCIFIVILFAALTIFVSYTMLFEDNTFIQDLVSANDAYQAAKKVDYDAQKVENEQLTSQIQLVNSEIDIIEANLKNIEAERAQKIIELRQEKLDAINKIESELNYKISDLQFRIDQELSQAPVEEKYLSSTSNLIYSLVLKGIDKSTADVVTFIGENADDGNYTIKFVGYIDSLTDVLNSVVKNMEEYNISVGHCSLRQIYACYNNMRPWDKATLLEWYDKTYITGSGTIGSVEGGYIVEGIKLSDLFYGDTITTLTAEKDKSIADNLAAYEAEVERIEADRIKSIIEAYKGTDQDKVDSLVNQLNMYYNSKIDEALAKCKAKEQEIIEIYKARLAAINYVPPQPEDTDGDGEPDTVIIDESFGDPELIIYTLDITFSVYNE